MHLWAIRTPKAIVEGIYYASQSQNFRSESHPTGYLDRINYVNQHHSVEQWHADAARGRDRRRCFGGCRNDEERRSQRAEWCTSGHYND